MNQLLSITHKIYESFDVGVKVMTWWYHLQTNSKWNIREFTKPFGGFCKGKKTMRSPQQTSLYIEKYQCWSSSRFHHWSFVVFDLHK